MTIPFIEPFRIKVVEKVRMTTREERVAALRTAHYNLFAVRGEYGPCDGWGSVWGDFQCRRA